MGIVHTLLSLNIPATKKPIMLPNINNVKEKALGEEVKKSLSPGEMFVGIIRDELIADACGLFAAFNSFDPRFLRLFLGIENSTYRKGGIWDVVKFGPAFHIFREFCFVTGLRFFIIFAVLVLAFINFIAFLLDHSKKMEWLFAWFLFVFDIRVATAEFSMVTWLFRNISFAVQYKLEYLGLWLAIIFYILFYYNNSEYIS